MFGLAEFGAGLDRIVGGLDRGTKSAIAKGAALVERKAKENASGPPGPGVVSGSNRRGITHRPIHRVGLGYQTEVGPTMIYSRRLELGFEGADSLGRVYHQKPRPFFTPAWNDVVHDLPRVYAEEWSRAITG